MEWRTHLSFGLLLALLVFYFSSIEPNVVLIFVTLIFSLFPDIDEFHSKISKKTRPFSFILNLFKHRGPLHSLTFFVGIALLIFFILGETFALFSLVGMLSHKILDGIKLKLNMILFWAFTVLDIILILILF